MADRPYMSLAVDPVRNDRTKLIATWHLLIRRGRGCGWGEPGRFKIISAHMKVQVGKDQENAQSERCAIRKRFPLQKPSREKTK